LINLEQVFKYKIKPEDYPSGFLMKCAKLKVQHGSLNIVFLHSGNFVHKLKTLSGKGSFK